MIGPRLLLLLLALPLIPLGACTPVDALNLTIPLDGVEVTRGIAFMDGPRGAMDVYRPARAVGPTPVVVFFYGGSWRSGARKDYRFVAAALARRGIVAVVPDYRLFPEVRFPTFLEDGARAVAAVQRRAAEWGGDPRRLVLAGHSAGAWIAAMLAVQPRWLAAQGGSRAGVAGMVGLAGPYDFDPAAYAATRDPFAGTTRAESQPVGFADAQAPPMLLLHGADDTTVEPRNSLALAARLHAAGVAAEARIYPGVSHVGIVASFAPLFRGRAPALDDMAQFVLTVPAAP